MNQEPWRRFQMKGRSVLIGLLVAATVLAAASAFAAGRQLYTKLDGAEAEAASRSGDQDGSGEFNAYVNAGRREICYQVTYANVAGTGVRIHKGYSGEIGPVVAVLRTPADGYCSDCLMLSSEIIHEMIRDPEGYYVTVHNPDYPDGAIRGQLSK
jgi:hypothetical protein